MAGTKKKPERYYYLLPKEFRKFLASAYRYSPIYGVIMEVTANAGFRISETLSLRVNSFDFENDKVKILTLKQKKADKVIDELILPHHTMEIVKKYIEIMKFQGEDKLFYMGRHSCWHAFKKILKLSKLDSRFSPHALRHLHGIAVTEITGGDMMAVARRLRHRDPRNAYRYYHLTEESQEKIAKGLEEKLKKDKEL